MRNPLRAVGLAFLVTLPFGALADVSEATYTPQGKQSLEAIREDQVEILVIKPEYKFRVIGVIEARGMAEGDSSILGLVDDSVSRLLGGSSTKPGEKEDIALAMKAIRKEAALNGLWRVLIVRSTQVRVSANATARKIIAVAITPE